MSQALITVEHVDKSFPKSLSAASWVRYRGTVPREQVLFDICLSIRDGELFGLLGANGAGKTTLLKMLATLCIPEQGKITIAGLDAVRESMGVKSRIGLCVSEERSFYFRLTAHQNLRFFGTLMGLYGNALERRIEEVLALVDLTAVLERRFDSFSSGMRQRLSVARALLGDPDIIFLDEPTRAVDPVHAQEIRSFVRDVLVRERGKTVILATNSLEEAWSICDRVAILRKGRVIAQDSPQKLEAQFTRFLRYRITLDNVDDSMVHKIQLMGGLRSVDTMRTIDGISLNIELEPTSSAIGEMLRILASNDAKVTSFRSEGPAPLDVFCGINDDGDAR